MAVPHLRPQPPVGRCIYCDATQGRLTTEHVIPRSLGGNVTLLKASCDDCAEITKKFEGYAARHIFQDVRIEFGLRMKEPPTHLPMNEGIGNPNTRLVPVTDHFITEPAGILTGKPPGTPFELQTWYRRIPADHGERRKRLQAQGLPTTLTRQLNLYHVAKLLAKIALGAAVFKCGVDGFRPWIRHLIREEPRHWHQWIGGTTEAMVVFPATDIPTLHRIAVVWRDEGVPMVLVQLQLFAYLNSPIYTIVVGELNEAGLKKLGTTHEIFQT